MSANLIKRNNSYNEIISLRWQCTYFAATKCRKIKTLCSPALRKLTATAIGSEFFYYALINSMISFKH